MSLARLDSLVRLDNVTRRFGDPPYETVALDEVSLAIEAAQLVGLFGPSGSGKTTLLNLVVGWDRPTEGTVTRHSDLPSDWSGMAIVPQALGLVAELTALENVELAAGVVGSDSNAAEYFGLLGMDPIELGRRLPYQLSLGQQQRVAIARALVTEPSVLVADEPSAHQDEENADRIFDVFARVAAEGSGVLVSTHDPRLLNRLDQVITLADGKRID